MKHETNKPMYERAEDLEWAIIVFAEEGVRTIEDANQILEELRDKSRKPRVRKRPR